MFYMKGDRVEMTEYAKKQIGYWNNSTYPPTYEGTVLRDQQTDLLYILRDDRKEPQFYHAKFWVLI